MESKAVVTWTSATALAALAGLHAAWGAGSSWPLRDRAALAEAVAGRKSMPGPVACFGVATALGAAAVLVSGRPRRRPTLVRIGAVGVAGVLGTRGAVGLAGRTEMLSPGSNAATFQRLDRWVYSPLCLALAAGSAVSAISGVSNSSVSKASGGAG